MNINVILRKLSYYKFSLFCLLILDWYFMKFNIYFVCFIDNLIGEIFIFECSIDVKFVKFYV